MHRSNERGRRTAAMAGIELQRVTKRYPDGTEGVKTLDLDIGDGEFMILVGPSGCGKSTALRMAMGRAIVREPQAFLMDEPLSNLDAKLRVQMRGEVARLQKRLGTTTLYVTHDQTEAMTLGDRVAVMRGGHLQQVGPPKELYANPVNLFVAGFIGSPAMNFVTAPLEEGRLRLPFGDVPLEGRLGVGLQRGDGSQR